MSPPTILVVDSQMPIRQVLARVLNEAGYAVLTADDGLAALALLEQRAVDGVVADVTMTQLDGLGLLAAVWAWDAAIPVLLMGTGNHNLSGLGVPVLTKPFDIDDLVTFFVHRVPVDTTAPSPKGASRPSD